MATYVNDLRLKEIATGDEAGTWGTSTNTNLELIGEALGYGTQDCFTTDADATTTVADGATDPARAMYFKVTSSATLTATRTLTIAPNTISRVMWIENATTGSQSITISQGSGANVTIATGKAAVVYLDGAGATAAVVDAMNLVDPGVTDTLAEVLTAGNATGGTDIAVGTGDDITFANNSKAIFGGSTELQIYYEAGASVNLIESPTYNIQIGANAIDFTSYAGTSYATIDSSGISLPDSAKAIFGAGSDLQIYHDGSNSYIDDAGTGALQIRSNGLYLQKYTNENMIRALADGAVSLYYDNAIKLDTTSTGIDVTGTVTADGLTVSPSSGDATLTLSSNASQPWEVYSPDASNDLRFKSDSTDYVTIDTNGNVGIGTSTVNEKLVLGAADSGSNFLQITNSTTTAADNRGFYLGLDANEAARILNRENTDMVFSTNDTEAARITSDQKFLVGTSTAHATSSTFAGLTQFSTGISIQKRDDGVVAYFDRLTNDGAILQFLRDGATVGNLAAQSSGIAFGTGSSATERLRIDSSGNVGIANASPSPLLWPNTSTGGLFFQAGGMLAAYNGGTYLSQNYYYNAGEKFITNGGASRYVQAGQVHAWYTSTTVNASGAGAALTWSESMRIDSSGNLLVGKSVTTFNTEGFLYEAGAAVEVTTDSARVMRLNLTTNDGSILEFNKDGTTVGSIGAETGSIYIQGNASSSGFLFGNSNIYPWDAGALSDAGIDLGSSSYRFKDLYLTNTAYITAPSTSTAVLQLENTDTSVVAGQSLGNITWRANDVSTGGTGIRGRIGCEATNAGTFYALTFATGQAATATEGMRLDSSGNLLVGTTTASTKLTVQGTTTGDVVTVLSGTTTNTNVGMIVFRDGASDFCGQITSNASTNTTSYNTSSDARLKENIADANDAGSKIDAIQVRQFDWIKSGLHQDYGMVAQELIEVAPEAVSQPEDPEAMMGVDYSKLVPMLIKEIQSLRARVAQLEGV